MKNSVRLFYLAFTLTLSVTSYTYQENFSKEANVKKIKREIIEKNNLSQKLLERSKIMYDGTLGSIHGSLDVEMHSCYILANLLNKNPVKFRVYYDIDWNTISEENGYNLQLISQSLENYSYNANRILSLSEDEQIIQWNLDCAGKNGSDYASNEDKRSTFYKIDDSETIYILGKIEDGFFQNLVNAIEENKNIKKVALGSGGGKVYEALKAGRYIRYKKLETTLYNSCYSACPLVFMGGVERTIMSPYPGLGFHKVSIDGIAIPNNSYVYSDILYYLLEMGINNPYYVLNLIYSASPQDMTMIIPDMMNDYGLCESGIATWVQRVC